MSESQPPDLAVDSPGAYFDRELSWLAFARRVLAQVQDARLPLLERVKFVGIMGMLHDEFFMKRMSGILRRIRKGSKKHSPDGLTAAQQRKRYRAEVVSQMEVLASILREELLPALAREGIPILPYDGLPEADRKALRRYFRESVQPILTPLAVDAEHPFPFISSDALNLAAHLHVDGGDSVRFVRIKVPDNRPRWVPLPDGRPGFVPIEQVIAANLDLMFPGAPLGPIHVFRVTRGAEGEKPDLRDPAQDVHRAPGSIVRQVAAELKARRFAGVVRLQVAADMPRDMVAWIGRQLEISSKDVYATEAFVGLSDLLDLAAGERPDLHLPRHVPVTHPRLRGLSAQEPAALFREIARGDILLHHPYHDFDTSVLRLLEAAAVDPTVLAIKLTIYRTNRASAIVQALTEAARRGKQVAVLVEITARFDEAPNIAWGKHLEEEGVHVAYGVEKLKTHVKLALVVREEKGYVRRYAHVGTGNYNTGTARIYEDVGILTSHPEVCEDVSAVFNHLTAASSPPTYNHMLVAPATMRKRFTELIRREAEHARSGRPCGIRAKMNQLQDEQLIAELYRASRAGVPIELNIRGLCTLRPGVPGLSETIRVFSVVGRFLEHSRIYGFANGGEPEYYIGSADWMSRNLAKRVETVMPVLDPAIRRELEDILQVYAQDNGSAWDAGPDGTYTRREPLPGERRRASQETFLDLARASAERSPTGHGAPVVPGAQPG